MLYYTDHARERMEQKGISRADVRFCLNNYKLEFEESNGNKHYIADHPSGGCIKVVLNDSCDTVISVMWVEG